MKPLLILSLALALSLSAIAPRRIADAGTPAKDYPIVFSDVTRPAGLLEPLAGIMHRPSVLPGMRSAREMVSPRPWRGSPRTSAGDRHPPPWGRLTHEPDKRQAGENTDSARIG
ncbi:MAG: hypothetical protein L0Z62_03955 [Gemmataceae bacterium]|nr:hypothetical protein [Gemmataceae bacterium]